MRISPEDRLIERLRRRVSGRGDDLIGDDAAFLHADQLAVTVDQQIAGVHFPVGLPPRVIGRRLVGVNMSDISAVGGRPSHGFLALAAPSDYPMETLMLAVEDALAGRGARLAGGDLAASEMVSASLTLLARRQPRGRWLKRSAARAGDRLWVGGTLGASALGRLLLQRGATFDGRRVELPATVARPASLAREARRAVRRHLAPPDQLDLGRWLARRRRAAAIDISDGLLLDLARLCRASNCGAIVDASHLPLAPGLKVASFAIGFDPLELALSGGEDYVLLFALPPTITPPAEYGATLVGRVTSDPGLELRGAPLPPQLGWDHLRATGRSP